jgi:hypothetical protein
MCWSLRDHHQFFHRLADLCSSVVPHERTNATTEALVDALYSCRLIVATFLFVTLCFSRNFMAGIEEYLIEIRYSFCYATL